MTAPVLADFVKAYDVRGVVPDQLNVDVAFALGSAFAQVVGAARAGQGRGHRPRHARRRRPSCPAPSPTASPRTASTSILIGLVQHRRPLLRQRRPRPARRDVHREPQPRAVQRDQAVPRRRAPGRPGHRARRDPRPRRRRSSTAATARPARTPSRGRSPSATSSPTTPRSCAALVDLSGSPPAQGRRRRRQRHGRPHRPGRPRHRRRPRRAAARRSSRSTSSSTAPSPTTRPTPSSPRTCATCRRRCVEHGADLGLAFDGDADRCFVIDERGEPVSPSAITALVATREIAREVAAGTPAEDVAIVYNVISSARRPRDHRRGGRRGRPHPRRPLLHQGRDGPRTAPSSAASTARTTTSATSGSPTPACSRRCTCWPRSGSRPSRSAGSWRHTAGMPRPARSTPPSPMRRPPPRVVRDVGGGAGRGHRRRSTG